LASTVIDYQAPSSARALAALDEGTARTVLRKFAKWCTGSDADAEDLFQETVQKLCDSDEGRPWDPTRGSFLAHARIVMREIVRRSRRSARARKEVLDGRLATDETMADSNDPPDEALGQARELDRDRRLGGVLRERLDPLTLRVFEQRRQGQDDGAELARLCECSVQEVYDANRSIAYHASRILAEEREAEAAGMKSLQKQAKRKSKWAFWRLPERET
jgi:RNA polymerase sigma factor (sigma-70 family)